MSRIFGQVLAYHLDIKLEEIEPTMNLDTDLGCDSLDCLEILMDIEEKLSIIITDEEAATCKTVQDFYDLINKKQAEKPVNQIPEIPKDEDIPHN